MITTRPKSLAEVARRILEGSEWRYELADFLDEFYANPSSEAVADEPDSLAATGKEGQRRDAFIAATAEHLGRKYQFPLQPWVYQPSRYLDHPSFALSTREGKLFLLKDSPAAFKSRNLFVSGNALERV
ncbi:MAG: hypothetical protein AAF514_11090 [Verrucomicrobiota bacterium]